jgi:hypothetical protein
VPDYGKKTEKFSIPQTKLGVTMIANEFEALLIKAEIFEFVRWKTEWK